MTSKNFFAKFSNKILARLMAQIPKEESDANNKVVDALGNCLDQSVRGGAFEAETEAATPFGFGRGEGVDKGSGLFF